MGAKVRSAQVVSPRAWRRGEEEAKKARRAGKVKSSFYLSRSSRLFCFPLTASQSLSQSYLQGSKKLRFVIGRGLWGFRGLLVFIFFLLVLLLLVGGVDIGDALDLGGLHFRVL